MSSRETILAVTDGPLATELLIACAGIKAAAPDERGNSNWRGPIWFPVNFLLAESLQKFHHYLVTISKSSSRLDREARKRCGTWRVSCLGG
jgi:hypothetical protein